MSKMILFGRRVRPPVLGGLIGICAMFMCAHVSASAVAASDPPKRLYKQGVTHVASVSKSALASASRSSSSPKSVSGKKSSRKHRARARREPTQKAPTPDRIREIQSALAREGYYQDAPSGKWDSRTVEAMGKFQQERGLTATGKLDALSLQKLGLGSEIAGVSAPQPATIPSPAGDPPSAASTPKSP